MKCRWKAERKLNALTATLFAANIPVDLPWVDTIVIHENAAYPKERGKLVFGNPDLPSSPGVGLANTGVCGNGDSRVTEQA